LTPLTPAVGARPAPDRHDYSETEEEYLAAIEEELLEAMDELVDVVLAPIDNQLE
jgi:hypothetical protein